MGEHYSFVEYFVEKKITFIICVFLFPEFHFFNVKPSFQYKSVTKKRVDNY